MNRIFEAALEAQRFCETNRFVFCIIGGVALQRWGEPRMTDDVDLTVLTGFGQEESFIEAFLRAFPSRISDGKSFALRNRVLLLMTNSGIGMDVALGAMPFEERAIQRSSLYGLAGGKFLRTCSAEDLIVHKAFANRDQDWIDIKAILIRQKGKINLAQILLEIEPLAVLKEEPQIISRLKALLQHPKS